MHSMTPQQTQTTVQQELAERFAQLPQSVQEAVTSAEVEKKLRALAQKHKLHLDQWVLLENEIMLTLLGLEDPENMATNIAKQVRVGADTAQAIVNDIATLVFAPIRQTLQQGAPGEGTRPMVKSTVQSDSDGLVIPGQTPAPQETPSTIEASNTKNRPTDLSGSAYQTGTSSVARKNVVGDPYREPVE